MRVIIIRTPEQLCHCSPAAVATSTAQASHTRISHRRSTVCHLRLTDVDCSEVLCPFDGWQRTFFVAYGGAEWAEGVVAASFAESSLTWRLPKAPRGRKRACPGTATPGLARAPRSTPCTAQSRKRKSDSTATPRTAVVPAAGKRTRGGQPPQQKAPAAGPVSPPV